MHYLNHGHLTEMWCQRVNYEGTTECYFYFVLPTNADWQTVIFWGNQLQQSSAKNMPCLGFCNCAIEISSLDFSTLKDEATILCWNTGHQSHSDMMPYLKVTEITAKNPHYLCLEHQGQQLLVTADPDPNIVNIADIQSIEFSPTITQYISQQDFGALIHHKTFKYYTYMSGTKIGNFKYRNSQFWHWMFQHTVLIFCSFLSLPVIPLLQ